MGVTNLFFMSMHLPNCITDPKSAQLKIYIIFTNVSLISFHGFKNDLR